MTLADIREQEQVALPEGAATALQRALYQAASPVYYSGDVKRYQKQALRKQRLREHFRHEGAFTALLLFPVLSLCIGLYDALPIVQVIPVWVITVGLLAAVNVAMYRLAAEWRTQTISDTGLRFPAADRWIERWYHMPTWAADRARTVRQLCPSAMFYLETLGPDPFLWVTDLDNPIETYCIAYWDAPGFGIA